MDLGTPVDLGFFKTNDEARNDVTAKQGSIRQEEQQRTDLGTSVDMGFSPVGISKPSAPEEDGVGVKDYGISLAKGVVGLAQSAYGIADLATLGTLEKGVNAVTGTTVAEKATDVNEYLTSKQSDSMQRKQKELDETKGFFASAGKVLSDPALAGSMLVESVPMMLSMAGAIRKVGAVAFEKTFATVMEREVANGVTKEAAKQIAMAEAASVAAARGTLASIGVNGVVEAGSNSQDTKSTIMAMSRSDLDMSPQFQSLIADGMDERDARLALAQSAGNVSGAIAGVIGAAASKYSGAGAFESNMVRKIFGFGAKDIASKSVASAAKSGLAKELIRGIGSEALEEGVQSAGEKLGENAGKNFVGKDTPMLEGVPEAVAVGATMGGLSGGAFAGAGHLSGRRKEPQSDDKGVGNTQASPGQTASSTASKTASNEASAMPYDVPLIDEKVLRQRAKTDTGLDFIAALYQDGSTEHKATIDEFIDRTSLRKPFERVLQNGGRLDNGRILMKQDSNGNQYFLDSMKALVEAPAKRGKAKFVPPKPVTEADIESVAPETIADANNDIAILNAQREKQGKPPITGTVANGVNIAKVAPKARQSASELLDEHNAAVRANSVKVTSSTLIFTDANETRDLVAAARHHNIRLTNTDTVGSVVNKLENKTNQKYPISFDGLEDTNKSGDLRFSRAPLNIGNVVDRTLAMRDKYGEKFTPAETDTVQKLLNANRITEANTELDRIEAGLNKPAPTPSKVVETTQSAKDAKKLAELQARLDKIEADKKEERLRASVKVDANADEVAQFKNTKGSEKAAVVDDTVETRRLSKAEAIAFSQEQTPSARHVSKFVQRYAQEVHRGVETAKKANPSKPVEEQIKEWVDKGVVFSNQVRSMPRAVQQYYNTRTAAEKVSIDEALAGIKPANNNNTDDGVTMLDLYKSYTKQQAVHQAEDLKTKEVKANKKVVTEKENVEKTQRNTKAKEFKETRTLGDKVRTRLKVRMHKILGMSDAAGSYELLNRMRANLEEEYSKKSPAPKTVADLEMAIKTVENRVNSMDSYVKTLDKIDQEIADLEGIMKGQKPRSQVEYIFIKGGDGNVLGNFGEDGSRYDAARDQLNRLIQMRRDIASRNAPALRDLFFSNYLMIGQELYELKNQALQYVEEHPEASMNASEVRELFKDAEAQVNFVQQSMDTSSRRSESLKGSAKELTDAVEQDQSGDNKVSTAQLAIEQKLNPKLQESMDEMMADLEEAGQLGMFGGQDMANAIVTDLVAHKVSSDRAVGMMADEIRKGSFTVEEARNAFRAMGIDAPTEVTQFLGQPHNQAPLATYIQRSGNRALALQEWMGSLANFLSSAPKWFINTRLASLSTAERKLFNEWKQQVAQVRNRRIIAGTDGTTLTDIFPNALFRQFSLGQMRDPSKIADPQYRNALTSLYGDGKGMVEQWLNDLYLVQTQRKDLFRTALRELAPTDRKQYIAWAQVKRRAEIQQAKLITSSAYWSQLYNITFPTTTVGRERFEHYKAMMYKADMDEQRAIVLDAFAEANLLAKSNYGSFKESIANLDKKKDGAEELLNDFFEEMRQRDLANNLNAEDAMEVMRQRGFDDNAPVAFNQEGQPLDSMDALDYAATGVYESEDSLATMSGDEDINDLESDSFMGGDDDGLMFKRGTYTGRLTANIVRNYVRDLTATWHNAPNISVTKNIRTLEEPLRSRAIAALGMNQDAKGMIDPDTGTVYLFSDSLTSQLDTQFTLFHEVFGHYGMRGVLGNSLDSFLKGVYKTNPTVRKAADGMVETQGMGLLEAVEEVLADQAAVGKDAGIFKIYMGKAINLLRQAGFDGVADFLSKMSDAEVAYTFKAAKAYALNGAVNDMNGVPSEMRFNRDKPNPYEIYAEKDGVFLGYARYNPNFGDWYVFAAKSKADIRNGNYKTFISDTYEEAIAALRKTGGRITERTRTPFYVDDTTPKSGFAPANMPKFNDVTGWRKLLRNGIIKVQNEFFAVREYERFLKDSGRMEGLKSPYQMLKLMESRAVHLLEQMDKTYYNPYLEKMKELKEEMGKDDVERDVLDFLYARHAPERNAAVKKIRPETDKGSGITNEEAADILKSYGFKHAASGDVVPIDPKNISEKARLLMEIGSIFEKMSQDKINYLIATGMLTQKQATGLRRYKYYVSLSGLPGEKLDEEDMTQFDDAKKLNVRGQDAKRALGRKTKADDIMARTFMGYRSSIVRGQKNLVGQAVLEMLEANKDPTFAKINPIAEKDVLENTGYRLIPDVMGYKTIQEYMVVKKLDENFINSEDVMVIKVAGRPYLVQFTDTTPGSVFDALHGRMFRGQSGPISEAFGTYNRIFGQMLTTWNPAWIMVNGVRDVQTAFFNAASDSRVGAAMAAKMQKRLPSALSAAAAYYGGDSAKSMFGRNPKMMKYMDEMSSEGGLTLFMNRQGGEEYMRDLKIAMHGPSTTAEHIREKTRAVTNFMEKFTTPMEVMPRLAAYATLRDNGWTAKDAAEYAKELTVNFNMRGQSKELRNMFVFFNPAVQGSAKIIELAINNPKRFAAVASSWAITGFMMSLVARAAGVGAEDEDGEEDPVNQLDQIPDYKRSTSMIFSPGGFAMPLAYGWNAFYALGHHGMDYLIGVQPLDVVSGRISKAFVEAYLPNTAGLEASTLPRKLLMTATPSALMPIAQLAINENRFGAPIAQSKNGMVAGETANSYMNFDSASPISTGLARGLNEMLGGTKYESSGLMDFNPSVIDFLINSYGAGIVSEGYKSASAGIKIARGEEIGRTPLPLIDRFTARPPENFDEIAFRRIRDDVKTVQRELKDPSTTDERKEFLRDKYENIGSANAVVTSIDNDIRALRDRKRIAQGRFDKGDIDREELSEIKNELRGREKALVNRAVRFSMESGFESPVLRSK